MIYLILSRHIFLWIFLGFQESHIQTFNIYNFFFTNNFFNVTWRLFFTLIIFFIVNIFINDIHDTTTMIYTPGFSFYFSFFFTLLYLVIFINLSIKEFFILQRACFFKQTMSHPIKPITPSSSTQETTIKHPKVFSQIHRVMILFFIFSF